MSDFEFVSIILSIVVGLAITRILSGLASLIELRRQLRMHWLTIGWSSLVLLWQVVYWFASVNGWRDRVQWTSANFGILLVIGITLYFAAALVLPRRIDSDTDLAQHYESVRQPLFAVFVAWPLLDMVDSVIGGIDNLMAFGPGLWIGHTATVGLGVLGLFTTSQRVHAVIVVGSLVAVLSLMAIRLYTI